jgi:glycosyltransferase involved in cell wall biosynthesis
MLSAERADVKVVQVGAYPPPYGGVTVHLMRLHDHLRAVGIESTILDLSATDKGVAGVRPLDWPAAVALLERSPRTIVHFHNFEAGHAGVYERLARRHVAVLSLHNERFPAELGRLGALRRRRALAQLRRLHCVVVDSEHSLELARGLWGAGVEMRVIPEFIAPGAVPPLEHPALCALRRRSTLLLASNAWRLCMHEGQDLYGLDLAVETVRRLVHDHGLDVGLAFLLPGGEAGDASGYLARMRRLIADLRLEQRVLIVTDPIEEASSLWREADVVLRATNTDGNSLSVLEALAVGTPVVASDCVPRPEGALLFRTRDPGDLTEKTAAVLHDLPAWRARVSALDGHDHADAFARLYGELTARWNAA